MADSGKLLLRSHLCISTLADICPNCIDAATPLQLRLLISLFKTLHPVARKLCTGFHWTQKRTRQQQERAKSQRNEFLDDRTSVLFVCNCEFSRWRWYRC